MHPHRIPPSTRISRSPPFRLAARLLVSAGMLLAASAGPRAATVPVIYSTDLLHPADDPDDHFDLACFFAMPEADLRAIVLDLGDRQIQRPGFRPVWQLNYLTARHVPAAIGLRSKLKAPEDPAYDQPAEHQNGVNLILQALQDSQEKVAIVFVGSARDVAASYNRRPDLFRTKVRSIHGFFGEASDPSSPDPNTRHDPLAVVRLMRSDLPMFWMPCTDGGRGINHGHATQWRIKHGDVLEKAPARLLRYFLYMSQGSSSDPIAFLAEETSVEVRNQYMAGQRNLWCAALLGMAVDRPLRYAGRDVAGFSPVDVSIDNDGIVSYGNVPGAHTVMRFELKDAAVFARAATHATAELLESFPIRLPAAN